MFENLMKIGRKYMRTQNENSPKCRISLADLRDVSRRDPATIVQFVKKQKRNQP